MNALKIINVLRAWNKQGNIEMKGLATDSDFENMLKQLETEFNNVVSDPVSKRYFAVNYVANSHNGQITGLIDITTNGSYLNREMTLVNIKEKIEGLSNIVITSTNEMSEEDFKTWQS